MPTQSGCPGHLGCKGTGSFLPPQGSPRGSMSLVFTIERLTNGNGRNSKDKE